MPFLIRSAVLDDERAVSALLLKSYTALLKSAYDAATLAKALPLITRSRPELLTSGSYYLAETEDGQLVGAGGWTKASPTGLDETENNGNIRHFGTDPEFTSRGIGRLLMQRCFEDAKSGGLSEFNCYSTLNGESFYRACGFNSIERFLVLLPGNVEFPSIRMTCPL
ncbi:GNAT family N-acetyltransferase [uncultured Roseibium sp.]|uniref:GNAT family N-acetyltransferase n=1 Tax=uncultured Roseibium sp. TaxID=1936171 RepID=UPI0026146EF1|nr:GNAT family N-acetyltransferase [uncultured Roseibium sp.]